MSRSSAADLGLPESPAAPDINHPRSCLRIWREEADYLEDLVMRHGKADQAAERLMARVWALRQCAQQLENRLTWSRLG